MKYHGFPILAGLLGITLFLNAESPRDLNKIIPVQRAIASAREALKNNDPDKAVRILESQQENAVGNQGFQAILKEAREKQTAKLVKEPSTQESSPLTNLNEAIRIPPLQSASPKQPSNAPANLGPPIPPAPPVEESIYPEPTPSVVKPVSPSIEPKPMNLISPPKAEIDPFQQIPSHGKLPTSDLSRADAAFAAKRYSQAIQLYQQSFQQGLKLSVDQRDQWVYARLFNLSTQLKTGSLDASQRQSMLKELADCRSQGSERMADFCDRLDKALQSGGEAPATKSPVGNFVLKTPGVPNSAEILEVANAARTAMYQRWSGASANPWGTPCEIYIHSCGKDYHQATRKPESLRGHSTMALKNADVVSRRLDLCGDDPHLLDETLPNEITQLILMEMFAEQPLPKWAIVGMAALSETPESVARYRRTVPGLLRDRKLLMLNILMEQQSFPESEATTAFFAQSISLVSFLVEKKGCMAFAAFLREAPRRGSARALQTHYGFKDVNELQAQWLKSLTLTP